LFVVHSHNCKQSWFEWDKLCYDYKGTLLDTHETALISIEEYSTSFYNWK
jgi:hypothetical protein